MDCCNHQCEACHKHKERTPEEMKALINRLNRIEGQVRGIRGMVENSAYCPDILTQVAATSAALNAFTKELLAAISAPAWRRIFALGMMKPSTSWCRRCKS